MYYIKKTPNAAGCYGSVMMNGGADSYELRDKKVLADYISAKGFVTLTLMDNTVASVSPNEEALAAYTASHPEPDPEQDPAELLAQRVADLEEAVQSLPAGGGTDDVWAEMAAAYREGVQSA